MQCLYRTADGQVLAIAAEVPTAHAGEAVAAVSDASPLEGVLRFDAATGAVVADAVPAAKRLLSQRAWRVRFSFLEQSAFELALEGYAADGITALTRAQRAEAAALDRLLHDGPTVDPTSDITAQGLGLLVALGCVAPARVAALTAPPADAELEA